ncbi:MAG: DUF4434 domain-containing protein [Deltaproteobacteria bacterium]|nr:DUF4434 domain-containing protein [Deltaproteobacteria bacterium]
MPTTSRTMRSMPSSPPSSSASSLRTLVVLALVLALAGIGSPGQAESPPAFAATFVQLWDRHENWPPEQWDILCADLAALGVRELILQWSLRTEPAFFWRLTPERRKEVPHDRIDPALAVEAVVQAAKRHDLRVRFGLTEDPAWWAEIKNEPTLVEVFLNRLLQDQLALARTLTEIYGQDDVFAGFYIPQEIDDQTWLDADRRCRLEEHLARLFDGLEIIRPGSSLAISCFATGKDDPRGFARFMARLACAGGIGLVLYQDGLGTERLLQTESAAYLQALVPALAEVGTRVSVVVETFAPTPDGRGFIPAPMARIASQLAQARSLTDTPITAFSLPDYVHPLAGPKAEDIFRAYGEYLLEIRYPDKKDLSSFERTSEVSSKNDSGQTHCHKED